MDLISQVKKREKKEKVALRPCYSTDTEFEIGIDEAQFFDQELVFVCEKLAEQGTRVIIAGLDMDYLGKPFGQMPNLFAIADYITKLHAICVKCGHIANVSYRIVKNENQILLGEKDAYEPRCRICCD